MNRKERRTEINSFIIKVLFFMTILVAAAMMYMKSKSIVDIGYFCVVFVLFIKFLIVKLNKQIDSFIIFLVILYVYRFSLPYFV